VAFTDRIPPRRVYLVGAGLTACSHFGFAFIADGFWSALLLRAIAGVGWAAAYMPGLKAIVDNMAGPAQSRAVSIHAAGVGVAGAISYAAAGLLDSAFGSQVTFACAGSAALVALLLVVFVVPKMPRPATLAKPAAAKQTLNFGPVFRNRKAMAWISGYTVHTLEMAALRAWGVTFLTLAAAHSGSPSWLPQPAILFAIAGLLGITVSIFGNELAQRYGRDWIVFAAIIMGAFFSAVTGWFVESPAPLAAALLFAWMMAIYLDSSALTAGTVEAADPDRRGATMGLHSMFGYAGGFVGPLLVGLVLDWGGSNAALGWGLGFGQLSILSLLSFFVFRALNRQPPPR
jgi:predicted MFS family arabinose efflux permease